MLPSSNSRLKLAAQLVLAFTISVAPYAIAQSDLNSVLATMDTTAAQFRSAQAKFTWTMFNSVINDVAEKQTGTIYFRRTGKETQMAADIVTPEKKQVVFSEGKIQLYQPKLETVDVYDASAHREEFETFLVLGFGSGGSDLRKSFEVKYNGTQKVGGVDAAELELTPKSENIRRQFSQILLWIDPKTGLSVQQKLVQPNGDYRLAEYTDTRLNEKIPSKVFKLQTSDKTKVITH